MYVLSIHFSFIQKKELHAVLYIIAFHMLVEENKAFSAH